MGICTAGSWSHRLICGPGYRGLPCPQVGRPRSSKPGRWRRRMSRKRSLLEAGSSALDGSSGTEGSSPTSRCPILRPHRSVKTTRGVDSHFGASAMHICRPAYPAVRQRLAARPPGCPWHTSGWGRGGSDPRQGLGTGSGRGGNSHLVPALLGSLPHQQSLAGRPSERRRGTRRINPILLRLPPLPKLLVPLSCQRPPAWSLAPATHKHPGPDTAIHVCLTQRPPSGFHPPAMETAGSMRRSGLPRVGLPPPCASSGPHIFPL